MKLNVLKMIAGGLLAGACSLAQAVPVTFTDVMSLPTFMMVDIFFPAVRFEHNIIDEGYNPATDTLTSVELTLLVRDDEPQPPFDPPPDPMVVGLDGVFDQVYNVGMADITIVFSDLSALVDGLLVVIAGLPVNPVEEWDWAIQASTLLVEVERDTVARVPVPGTLLLLLGGLLLLSRRQLKAPLPD